jgi:hypothetical protein
MILLSVVLLSFGLLGLLFHNNPYANGPGDAASVCRLREAVGAGDQSAVGSPQRDDVPRGRRCPFVEPPRWGLVQVPEDHPADLAAQSLPLAGRDAVFAAFLYRCYAKLIQINSGSLMFTLSGCLAGHVTGSYPLAQPSERADLSGRCSMASAVGETCGHGVHVPAAWAGLSSRCPGSQGRPTCAVVNHVQRHLRVALFS